MAKFPLRPGYVHSLYNNSELVAPFTQTGGISSQWYRYGDACPLPHTTICAQELGAYSRQNELSKKTAENPSGVRLIPPRFLLPSLSCMRGYCISGSNYTCLKCYFVQTKIIILKTNNLIMLSAPKVTACTKQNAENMCCLVYDAAATLRYEVYCSR